MSFSLVYSIHIMLGNFPDVKFHIFGLSMLCVDALDVLQFHIFGIVCLQRCLFDSRYARQYSGRSVSHFWYCMPSTLFI